VPGKVTEIGAQSASCDTPPSRKCAPPPLEGEDFRPRDSICDCPAPLPQGERDAFTRLPKIMPPPQTAGFRYTASMKHPRLVLLTRFPVAGMAKTRLIEAVGAQGAAEVHRRLTERTVKTLCVVSPVEVHFTGAAEAAFRDWLGDGIVLAPQAEGGLSERLLGALNPAPVIFFGADTPDLTEAHVSAAIEALSSHDVVIGPAEDGGYYLIGVRKAYRFLFTDMPWSSAEVLPETLRRAQQEELRVALLETLSDCDTPQDLARWPWLTV
jgi:uncharacterized protein